MTSISTAVVFPGQGSQRPGILASLPHSEAVDRLIDAAEALSGMDLTSVDVSGSSEDLADTRVAQPLLFLADWAWGTALLERGLRPIAVAGHSLGELAALAVAGAYSVEAGLQLVVERSRLMAAAADSVPGGMAAVLGMERRLVEDVVASESGVWVANDNSPDQVVVSGTHDGIAAAESALSRAGARRIVRLDVAGPFHSPLMASAAEAFGALLGDTDFREPAMPVLQNAEPIPTTDPAEIKARLGRQITSPVRWNETMTALADMGVTSLVEAGPGSVLAGLARAHGSFSLVSVDRSGVEGALRKVIA